MRTNSHSRFFQTQAVAAAQWSGSYLVVLVLFLLGPDSMWVSKAATLERIWSTMQQIIWESNGTAKSTALGRLLSGGMRHGTIWLPTLIFTVSGKLRILRLFFFDGRLVFEEVLAVVLVLPLSHGSMAIKLLISLLDELLEWFVECQRSPGWILGPCQELDNGQGAGPHLEKLLAIWSCLKEVLWNGDKWLVLVLHNPVLVDGDHGFCGEGATWMTSLELGNLANKKIFSQHTCHVLV